MSRETQAKNIIELDFSLPKLKPTRGMKKVQQLQESARVAGVRLAWVGSKLDDKWVNWHKSVARG